jgi:hypothetical protein
MLAQVLLSTSCEEVSSERGSRYMDPRCPAVSRLGYGIARFALGQARRSLAPNRQNVWRFLTFSTGFLVPRGWRGEGAFCRPYTPPPSPFDGRRERDGPRDTPENIDVLEIVNVYAALHVIICVSPASSLHSRDVGMCGF